jgi:hypothetical protein
MCVLIFCVGAVLGAEPVSPAAPGGKAELTGAGARSELPVRVEKLGNPLAKRYPDGSAFHYARTISDLQEFDGKLYVGHGDIVLNSGPTDIWYYDLHKKEFVKQGQIEDEAADHYRVINGRLYLPGMDPREDWSMGNFYRLEDGEWVKHRTLPGSLHSTDIVGIGNSLFALSSREKPPMCLMESSDDGKTWNMHDMPAVNQRIERRLIVLNGSVYITTVDKAGDLRVYRFNGKGFDPCTGEMFPGAEPLARDPSTFWSWSTLEKPTVFKGRIVYIAAHHRLNFKEKDVAKMWPLYKTLGLFAAALSGPNAFRAERSLTAENLTDIAVDDNHCYVVSYRWTNAADPKQGAVCTVFASADLKQWSKLFSFHSDALVSAIEVVGGDFYLGLGGTRQFCTPMTGMILKVGKEELTRQKGRSR